MARPMPTYADVVAARARIGALACRTPLVEHPALNAIAGGRVLLKAENLQRVGAFKFRGAYNKIAQVDKGAYPGGVVACSSGNHAQGVAAAATLRGLKSTIVMPSDAPRLKIERTKAFGGEVVPYDRVKEDRDAIAREICQSRSAAYIHPFDDPDVIAGQGTAGLELQQQSGGIDVLIAPVGGGGLISGCAIAARGTDAAVAVYAAEPEGAPDAYESFRRGERFTDITPNTIADGLRGTIGAINFTLMRENVREVLPVSEAEIVAAMRLVWERLKQVIEPSSATVLAAILRHREHFAGRRVGVVLSGGNVDLDALPWLGA